MNDHGHVRVSQPKLAEDRRTPHVAIFLVTIIPMLVLVAVRGDVNTLGDMYAFGLLGAFTLTCVAGMSFVIAGGMARRPFEAISRRARLLSTSRLRTQCPLPHRQHSRIDRLPGSRGREASARMRGTTPSTYSAS